MRASKVDWRLHRDVVLKVYSVTVPENIRVGSQLTQVTAVDPDAGSNSALRYVMSSSSSTSSWFSVNQHTGVIRLTKSLDHDVISATKSLDRERFNEMQFHVSLISYSCSYKYSWLTWRLRTLVCRVALLQCALDFHYLLHAFHSTTSRHCASSIGEVWGAGVRG